MEGKLDGRELAILVADGFEQHALRSDQSALGLIEEVSCREEWTWAKWLLIVGIMTFFGLGIKRW